MSHEVIAKVQTDYNGELTIAKTEDGRFLLLLYGNDEVGAINMRDPDKLYGFSEIIYRTVDFLRPTNIFMIGHGVGILSRKFFMSGYRSKVAEIDEKMVHISRNYFGFNGDNVVVGDGYEILMSEPDRSFDYILLDAFIDASVPNKFISLDFMNLVRKKLTSDGFFVVNHVGKLFAMDERTNEIKNMLKIYFPHVTIFTNVAEPDQRGNFIFIAGPQKLNKEIETQRFFQV